MEAEVEAGMGADIVVVPAVEAEAAAQAMVAEVTLVRMDPLTNSSVVRRWQPLDLRRALPTIPIAWQTRDRTLLSP